MKHSLLFFSLFIFSTIHIIAQTPTFAGLPGPEHVLVVYKLPDPNNPADTISRAVKDYYVNARNIPASNIVLGLTLPDEWLTYGGTTHRIEIVQSGDIIKDTTQAWQDSVTNYGAGATFHAWQYFYEHIAVPIKNHLENTFVNGVPLKETIRYIVLCKGVPYKIQSRFDLDGMFQPGNKNVSLQSLLSILNNEPYHTTLETMFFGYIDRSNPYYEAAKDNYWHLDYRFLPDFYVNSSGVKLSYLVTRLDGLSYADVQLMIDNAVNADTSGLHTWILDATESGFYASFEAADILSLLDFEVYYDNSSAYLTNNQFFNNNQVICYQSGGINSGMPEGYIQDLLQFTYAPGAVFNTLESFNGNSFGEIKRRAGHGLLTEFIKMGGTGGVCYPWEPGTPNSNIVNGDIFFPAYALGYNLVDAIYMNMYHMLYQNVIAGDPLTRIYKTYQTKIIASDTTITSGDIDGIRVIVPEGKTLTIDTGSEVLYLKRNADLLVNGNLIIRNNAKIQLEGLSSFRLADGVVYNDVQINLKHRSRFIVNGEFTLGENSVINLYNRSKIISVGSSNTAFLQGSVLNAYDNSSVSLNNITFNSGFTFNFYDHTELNANNVIISENSNLNFYNYSLLNVVDTLKFFENIVQNINSFSCGSLLVNQGAEIHIQNGYGKVNNELKILGNANNPISIYNGGIHFYGSQNAYVQYCNFYQVGLYIPSGNYMLNNVIIQNCIFNNCPNTSIASGQNILIKNCTYLNCPNGAIVFSKSNLSGSVELKKLVVESFGKGNAIYIYNINSVLIDSCLITDGGSGILVREVNNINIQDNSINQVVTGLIVGQRPHQPDEGTILNQISIKSNNIQTESEGIIFFENNYTTIIIKDNDLLISGAGSTSGISIDFGPMDLFYNTVIEANRIWGSEIGIAITRSRFADVVISGNVLDGNINGNSIFGISISDGNEVLISNNKIINYLAGISLSMVRNPSITGNTISAIGLSVEPYSGIISVSSNGQIWKNRIKYHWNGIELGSSSPKIGENIIIANKSHGIYISDNSNPDLSGSFVGDVKYPLSGYNTIRENGECEILENSELYLKSSLVKLDKGCNTIADDREDAGNCNYLYLIDGNTIPDLIIKARGNYWGNHPVYGNDPTGRFGQSLAIDYSDFLPEPCLNPFGTIKLMLANSKGEVYDTVYSTEENLSGLSDIESKYANANEHYYNNQYSQARQEYEEIIQNYGNDKESIQAYNRLYTIASLINNSPAEFNQLKDFYLQQASNQTDSLMINTLTHLGDLCLVASEEYLAAINNFDEIARQNPNTDIALYRQIDALTTSLLVPQDSSLNKGVLGKYSIDNLSDYTNKLSELLKTRGKSGLKSNEELIPKEFTLYQNYPNPFNPVTTIKYDLPAASDVSLIIYDVLGRKVKELVNTKQEAGRYEIQFNASNLASGVYIYQLTTPGFTQAHKMILAK